MFRSAGFHYYGIHVKTSKLLRFNDFASYMLSFNRILAMHATSIFSGVMSVIRRQVLQASVCLIKGVLDLIFLRFRSLLCADLSNILKSFSVKSGEFVVSQTFQ